MKKLLLSVTAIASITAPAVMLSSCNDEPDKTEVELSDADVLRNYLGRTYPVHSVCSINNIHDVYTKQEKKLLKEGKIESSHLVRLHISWPWRVIGAGTWQGRGSFKDILQSGFIQHFCSRNRDFKMIMGSYPLSPGFSWKHKGKKILFAPEKGNEAGDPVFHIGNKPVNKDLGVHLVDLLDESNLKTLIQQFTDFAKGELNQEQMDDFYSHIIQQDASDKFKEGVKNLITVPKDSGISYYTDGYYNGGGPVIRMAFTRGKSIYYFEDGVFLEKAVKPILMSRTEFNEYIKKHLLK